MHSVVTLSFITIFDLDVTEASKSVLFVVVFFGKSYQIGLSILGLLFQSKLSLGKKFEIK